MEATKANEMVNNQQSKEVSQNIKNTANFTPDDWVKYITPLVNRALAEAKEGINPEHLYQEFILSFNINNYVLLKDPL